jgi:hypothetical protein
MLRFLVVYSGFFLLTISCGKRPGKYAEFNASMMKIRDSLRVLDKNNKVMYFMDDDGTVGCYVTIRNQNINNNLFELPQCEDCFSFHTGKSQSISNGDSFLNYGRQSGLLRDDILNKTPKGLIWKRFKILYDNPQDTFSFNLWYDDSTHWEICSATGKKAIKNDSSGQGQE